MTDIEERAKDYSNIAQFGKGWQYVAEEGYINGATDQQKKDIEKACNEFCDFMNYLLESGRATTDEVDYWVEIHNKAMEE